MDSFSTGSSALISSNRKIFATLHCGSRSMKEFSGILDYLDDFLEIRRIDTAQWNVCGVPLVLAVLQRAWRVRQGNRMLTKGGSSWWQVWLSNPISQNPKWLLSLFGLQNTFVGTFHFCSWGTSWWNDLLINWVQTWAHAQNTLWNVFGRYVQAYRLWGILLHGLGDHKWDFISQYSHWFAFIQKGFWWELFRLTLFSVQTLGKTHVCRNSVNVLSKGLELDLANLECLYMRASCYHALGEFSDAVRTLNPW